MMERTNQSVATQEILKNEKHDILSGYNVLFSNGNMSGLRKFNIVEFFYIYIHIAF